MCMYKHGQALSCGSFELDFLDLFYSGECLWIMTTVVVLKRTSLTLVY